MTTVKALCGVSCAKNLHSAGTVLCVYLQVSHGNRKSYCEQHGYKLLDGTGWYGSRGVGLAYYSWLKVEFVCKMMEQNKHHQWLFWMDKDALFMNTHIKLSRLLVRVTENDIIIVAADAESLNAGTLLIRNNQQGRKFCQDWIGRRYKFRYEQQALSTMYNQAVRERGQECIVKEQVNLQHPSGVKACLDQRAPGFRVLKLCAMGSWGGLEWKRGHGFYFQGFYMYGDFIVHFAGSSVPKLPQMKRAQQNSL